MQGWVFTIATGIMLICPGLVQDGMFMDGQQYACVAKQLADGNGTFWFPHLSATWSKKQVLLLFMRTSSISLWHTIVLFLRFLAVVYIRKEFMIFSI